LTLPREADYHRKQFEVLNNFEETLSEKNPKYIILSVLEKSPVWAYDLPVNDSIRFKSAVGFDTNGEEVEGKDQIPVIIIYEVKY